MSWSAQTSFIPKQALEQPTSRASHSSVGLLFVLAFVVFLVSGIVFGGALLYRSILTAEINAPCDSAVDEIAENETAVTSHCGLTATVEREKKNIDLLTIQTLQRLDKKLAIAGDLLQKHNSLLVLFRLLEKNTLPSIAYTNFNYAPPNLSLDGVATSYEDIAVQTQIWNDVKKYNLIRSFIFSDLDKIDEDQVRFKLTLAVDPTLVLAQNQSQDQNQAVTTGPAATTTTP